MKKWLLSLITIFSSFSADAQLGVTVAPTSGFSPDWQIAVENFITHRRTSFLGYGVTGLVDYHLPTRSAAWSMRPAVHVMRSKVSYRHHRFEVVSLGLQGNVNFAPFLVGKSEAGQSIFYIQFSPGVDYLRQRYDRPLLEGGEFAGQHQRFNSYRLAPNVGLNLLWEFELTHLLSVAPQIGIRYYPALCWDNFTELIFEGEMTKNLDQTNWRHLTFGLRIGLNLEEVRGRSER